MSRSVDPESDSNAGLPVVRADQGGEGERSAVTAADRHRIDIRQQSDIALAVRAVRKLLRQHDYGAGKGSPASALASLVKALETLHDLEAGRIGPVSLSRRAIILLPVEAATMDDWQAGARRTLGESATASAADALPPSYRAIDDD
jgi:hypothetical protein